MAPTASPKEQEKQEKRPRTDADRFKQAGFPASRESTPHLPPEVLRLIRDKDHPLYDPRVDAPVDPAEVPGDEKYAALVADIEANGVRKAVTVRRNGLDDKNLPILEVVEGRQRVKITIWLNVTKPLPDGQVRTVPIQYEEGSDGEMVLVALSHKLGRDEHPFPRAWKIRTAKKLGVPDEQIAQACGWGERTAIIWMKKHLALLSMVEEVQQAFNGELPAACIDAFADVPREKQLEVLAKVREVRAAEGDLSTAKVKAAAKAVRMGTEYQAPKKIKKIDPEWLHRVKDALEKQEMQMRSSSTDASNGWIASHSSVKGALALAAFLCGDGLALNNFPHVATAVASASAPQVA